MPSSPAFVDHCCELLGSAVATTATAKRMFGGHALYLDGLVVALVVDDTLYLKADGETMCRFQAAGCKPFGYARRGAPAIITSYWSAPDEALESPALLAPWLQGAQAAALRSRATKARPSTGAAGRPRPRARRP